MNLASNKSHAYAHAPHMLLIVEQAHDRAFKGHKRRLRSLSDQRARAHQEPIARPEHCEQRRLAQALHPRSRRSLSLPVELAQRHHAC